MQSNIIFVIYFLNKSRYREAVKSLCTTAYDALDGASGAVVLLNYKTGEILAMTSTPAFDPKNIDKADLSEGSSVLVNRAIQGRYVPGSIFKVITLAAALNNGISEDWSYTCNGKLALDGDTVTCSETHGKVNLKEAFAESCNCAFAKLGNELGADKLLKQAKEMGLFNEYMFADMTLYASSMGISSTSKESEVGWAAVGQDKDAVTPLLMCMLVGGIANGGMVKEPRLVKSQVMEIASWSNPLQDMRIMSAETAAEMEEYMQAVVEDGTGTRAAIKGLTVCGKTGTAEVGGSKDPNAWFIGYVAEDQHPLAVAVVVEDGGTGGKVAAPIAKKLLQAAIDKGY